VQAQQSLQLLLLLPLQLAPFQQQQQMPF